ncbi:MAG: hypothetical protein KDM91_22240 [Verrucomicrobiae bacterium]|nr:hypothetical protein [Verrucomicrobiae bacterium]MCP5539794.1 hypothetical protein [Akkermansiaceae bacterium]
MTPLSPFSDTAIGEFDELAPLQKSKAAAPPRPQPAHHHKDLASHVREIDARVTVLETAILEHATILRDRIGQRLDRLEQKLRFESNGLRKAMESQSADRDHKIVELTQSLTSAMDRVESNHQAVSVKATMEDLIAALATTRNHLDTLAQAVTTTRAELSA